MSHVFRPFLGKFILVFFDDILVYSASQELHIQHLKEVFSVIRHSLLLAKNSKCFFWHDQGREPKKAQVVADWPTPKSVKGLRSFSGFAGHYKRFVQNYAILAKPLTDLLKKGEVLWSSAATPAFKSLKVALITAPVLELLDFSKLFVVETKCFHEWNWGRANARSTPFDFY